MAEVSVEQEQETAKKERKQQTATTSVSRYSRTSCRKDKTPGVQAKVRKSPGMLSTRCKASLVRKHRIGDVSDFASNILRSQSFGR
jgi:hypothetical protein